MTKVNQISELIKNLQHDLKGEVIIAGLKENDIISDDWIVSFDGLFKRGFSNDLCLIDSLKTNTQELINIHLSRDGIYDSLPEGLFHPTKDKPTESGKEMALESKKERKRESEARLFFKPFEQELFGVRLKIEEKERDFLKKLVLGQMSDLFLGFWKVDTTIDKTLSGKLVAYLPFANKIKGDYDVTFELLEIIIEEKVTYHINRTGFKTKNPEEVKSSDNDGFTLGKSSLGWNFVCGDDLVDLTPEMNIAIGPLKSSKISDFFEGGKLKRFIDCFSSFFLPLEFDNVITIDVAKPDSFTLPDSTGEVIMGYETYL